MAGPISEPIPNEDNVYRRFHRDQYDEEDNTVIPMVFDNKGKGMSTDWSKYSSPEKCRNRAPNPEEFGVLTLKVKQIREIESQDVEHTPTKDNNSHSDVTGEKNNKIRIRYLRIYNLEIKPEQKK